MIFPEGFSPREISSLRVNHPSGGSINDILYRKYVLTSSPGQLVNRPSRIRDFVF